MSGFLYLLCATDFGHIGHFQAVGHVASEAHIKDSRADTLVLDDVNNAGHQWTRLPRKGAAGFEDDLQVGIALVETLHQSHQSLDVVVLARDEVTTAKVDPLQLREPAGKLLLNVLQGALEDIGTALTMAMAMETLDVLGQMLGQLVGHHTKTGAGSTGIVQQRTHLGILRIDAQSYRALPCPLMEPFILTERVERQVTGTTHNLVEFVILIRRRIGVRLGTELL